MQKIKVIQYVYTNFTEEYIAIRKKLSGNYHALSAAKTRDTGFNVFYRY